MGLSHVDSKRASGCARRRVGAQCRVLEGFYWRRAACARKSCASSKGAVVVRCRKVGTGEWKCRQPVTKPGPPALALSRSNLISSHPPHHILSRHCHFLGRLVMLSLSVPWETAEDKTVKKVRCGSCAGCLGEDCGTCAKHHASPRACCVTSFWASKAVFMCRRKREARAISPHHAQTPRLTPETTHAKRSPQTHPCQSKS